jgi:hypothetical protein
VIPDEFAVDGETGGVVLGDVDTGVDGEFVHGLAVAGGGHPRGDRVEVREPVAGPPLVLEVEFVRDIGVGDVRTRHVGLGDESRPNPELPDAVGRPAADAGLEGSVDVGPGQQVLGVGLPGLVVGELEVGQRAPDDRRPAVAERVLERVVDLPDAQGAVLVGDLLQDVAFEAAVGTIDEA